MNPERPLDREDPFGSLLDEKPPEGWDERFLEEVHLKIETRRQEPESSKLPQAPRRRRKTAVVALAGVIGVAAMLAAGREPVGTPSSRPEDPSPTVVLVDGSGQPDVAVEWSSRAGRASDIVVLRSFGPEVSYLEELPPGEQTGPPAIQGARSHPSPAARGHVLVQLFRGHRRATLEEVSTTTIFREPSFLVPAVTDLPPDSDDDLRAQMQALYELEEVSSLDTSLVALSGGMAVVDSDGDQVRIQMEGQILGDRTVRLVIRQHREGMEDSAMSVVARYGKTFMLPRPAPHRQGGDSRPLFVCLTPYPSSV